MSEPVSDCKEVRERKKEENMKETICTLNVLINSTGAGNWDVELIVESAGSMEV